MSRELRRNRDPATGGYQPERAETLARARQRRPKTRKLLGNRRLAGWVQDRLDEWYSPEQIAGRLVIEYPDDASMRICHEAIYQAIYQAIYLYPRGSCAGSYGRICARPHEPAAAHHPAAARHPRRGVHP